MTTFAGLLSKGAVLSYKDGSTTKTIAAVKSIPAMGADPEKVDVTHLGSDKKAYIAGIQDTDNMEFAIIYQGDNFKDIDTLVKTGKSVDWTVTYSDGLKVTFTGQPSYKFDGVEVNQALGFNLVVVVSAGPDFTPVSTPAGGGQ
ncbi:phage tail tube protein [Lactococcus lactis]|uniref:phage tail tube protein n=1 Tax=Lactococcus lactis TaxID=1358 RepID=UPI001021D0D9|nr:phage tail tube protein [Lactococcus lactis]QBC36799.1 phage tail protein [Lactococcus lactis]